MIGKENSSRKGVPMKTRQVYQRQGVIHVCFKGGLFAPPCVTADDTNLNVRQQASQASRFNHKDRVFVFPCPDEDPKSPDRVDVFTSGRSGLEEWTRVHIPTKAELKESREQGEALAIALDTNMKAVFRLGDETESIEHGTNILDLGGDEPDGEWAVQVHCFDCEIPLDVMGNDTVASLDFDDEGNEIDVTLCGPCGRQRDRAVGVL